MAYTKQSLIHDFQNLGISKGDVVFIRISYKSIGEVKGGPKTVVEALLEVLGEEGTLLATAFPKRIYSYTRLLHRKEIYKKGSKPTTGIIPVIMSSYPNAHFSDNPLAPYVVIGSHAEEITKAHSFDSNSYDIVRYIIEHFSPKCLRIGGNILDGTTHLSFSEGLKHTNSYQLRLTDGVYYIKDGKKLWKEKSSSAFCHRGFETFFNTYIYPTDAVLKEGKVGDGQAMVTCMKSTYEIESKYLSESPKIVSCDSPSCLVCRTSFSYSDTSNLKFAANIFKNLFTDKWKKTLEMYCTMVLISMFGKRCI